MYSFDGLLGEGTVGIGTGPRNVGFVPPTEFFQDNTIPAQQRMTTKQMMTIGMNSVRL
jgi:hypothetical protein